MSTPGVIIMIIIMLNKTISVSLGYLHLALKTKSKINKSVFLKKKKKEFAFRKPLLSIIEFISIWINSTQNKVHAVKIPETSNQQYAGGRDFVFVSF